MQYKPGNDFKFKCQIVKAIASLSDNAIFNYPEMQFLEEFIIHDVLENENEYIENLSCLSFQYINQTIFGTALEIISVDDTKLISYYYALINNKEIIDDDIIKWIKKRYIKSLNKQKTRYEKDSVKASEDLKKSALNKKAQERSIEINKLLKNWNILENEIQKESDYPKPISKWYEQITIIGDSVTNKTKNDIYKRIEFNFQDFRILVDYADKRIAIESPAQLNRDIINLKQQFIEPDTKIRLNHEYEVGFVKLRMKNHNTLVLKVKNEEVTISYLS